MRRRLQLLLLLLLIAGTTETGMRASTDCERWMAAYKTQLAHAKTVRRVLAARARVKHAAQRKLANYVIRPSHPKPMLAHFVRPRYTRQQILDRFNILCGDLPGGGKGTDKLMEGKITPVQYASEMTPFVPLAPGTTDDGGLIPPTNLPPYTPPGGGGGFTSPGGGVNVPPIIGGGGGGGGGTNPSTPGTPGTPTGPELPTPPVSVVPEPGSLLLVVTGVGAALGAARRRVRR